jgi:type IV secretory pathway VirB10-like protein
MDTTLDQKQADPRHVLTARADEELAHAYSQITRAGEEIARAEEQLAKLERAGRRAGAARRPSRRGRAVRGVIGLMLAACICVAAFVWHSPYGDAARQTVSSWAPQLVAIASLPLEKSGVPARPGSPVVLADATKAAPPQPAALAQSAADDVAPAPASAALSPDMTQLLQSMARDVAAMGQSIEQIKASQERMARDHVNAVDLLRASQEQMARVIAKTSEAKTSEARTSEQNARPRASAPPSRPVAAPARKPVPTF